MNRRNTRLRISTLLLTLLLALNLAACSYIQDQLDEAWPANESESYKPRPDTDPYLFPEFPEPPQSTWTPTDPAESITPDADIEPIPPASFDYIRDVPEWDGETAWIEINGNTPYFTSDDVDRTKTEVWEEYSELDSLGRCGVAYANLCYELMPQESRKEIGSVKPSGWHTVTYPELIKDRYLYNRCHLIGFQLAGENANKLNLITGTRFLNINGMLDFENLLDDYIDDGHLINEDRHVLYRVTPIFEPDELVARGVLMEGYSVEDMGESVCFCVFAYNNQPGIEIDYMTGESRALE